MSNIVIKMATTKKLPNKTLLLTRTQEAATEGNPSTQCTSVDLKKWTYTRVVCTRKRPNEYHQIGINCN